LGGFPSTFPPYLVIMKRSLCTLAPISDTTRPEVPLHYWRRRGMRILCGNVISVNSGCVDFSRVLFPLDWPGLWPE